MKPRNKNFGQFFTFDVKIETCTCMAPRLTALLTFVSLIFCTHVIAQEPPNLAEPKIIVPEQIAGVTTVSAEQVIQALSSEPAPILIDARIQQDRNFGFIENSISLPDIETNCDTLNSKVTSDKKRRLMFYCNGVQCGRSVVALKVARSCGYLELSWFKGGFAEWKSKGYQYVTRK